LFDRQQEFFDREPCGNDAPAPTSGAFLLIHMISKLLLNEQ